LAILVSFDVCLWQCYSTASYPW